MDDKTSHQSCTATIEPPVGAQDISWDYYILCNSRLAENDESRERFYSVIADICNYGWFLSLDSMIRLTVQKSQTSTWEE